MSDRNRRLVLAERPSGTVDEGIIRTEESDVPEPGPGEALAKVRYLSIDPTIRTWMDDAPGYLPPIGIGEVVRSSGVAEVLQSNCNLYAPGDLLFGLTGWQDYVIADAGERAMQKLPAGVSPTAALGVLGLNGVTAYFGLLDVGKLKEGDVVVVSGAAGATGSAAGQIAKLRGAAKVVGIAGGPEKCAWIVDELGFDAAIDYKGENVAERLRELCPDGIDLYFDNVGGEILNACLAQLAMRGRIVLCGAISSYNESERVGPSNYGALIIRRGRMEGFIVLDYFGRLPEAQAELAAWLGAGELKAAEHVVEGLEHAPDALNLLFTGGEYGEGGCAGLTVSARTAVVTGANAGLGLACVRALLEQEPEWHVVLAVRDPGRGREAAAGLSRPGRCTVLELDLASLSSVSGFPRRYSHAELPPLRAVICNAGLQMTSAGHRSEDGFELTFAVNHLGHFALTQALLEDLQTPARIVIVSSDTHDPSNRTGMPVPRYTTAAELARMPAAPASASSVAGRRCYTTSKLCNLLFAYELDRRLGEGAQGITVNAFNPGLMPGSGLARDYGALQRFAWRFVMPAMRMLPQVRGVEQSGRDLAMLVGDPAYESVTGRYFDGLKPIRSSADSYDLEKARDLWETSDRFVATASAPPPAVP
jgi:NADPH-dependent curcumin reductase CurA/NAD(P)-dependent dehydrogenase (short-subunit alcohol dehydrogenase family)